MQRLYLLGEQAFIMGKLFVSFVVIATDALQSSNKGVITSNSETIGKRFQWTETQATYTQIHLFVTEWWKRKSNSSHPQLPAWCCKTFWMQNCMEWQHPTRATVGRLWDQNTRIKVQGEQHKEQDLWCWKKKPDLLLVLFLHLSASVVRPFHYFVSNFIEMLWQTYLYCLCLSRYFFKWANICFSSNWCHWTNALLAIFQAPVPLHTTKLWFCIMTDNPLWSCCEQFYVIFGVIFESESSLFLSHPWWRSRE